MPNVVLDFDGLNAGDVVGDQYLGQGVAISSGKGSKPPMVFDRDSPTGDDDDLATDNMGNVLIISKDGDSGDPDANGKGGSLRFDFESPAVVDSLRVLDFQKGGRIRCYDENGDVIKVVRIAATDDNEQKTVDIDCEDVRAMEVWFPQSGAIDDIRYAIDLTGDPDGIVDGTDGDDEIDLAYTGDPDGDRIDHGDAILPGEVFEDDIVLAGAGNDTVRGGAGDDEIWGDRAAGESGPVTITIDGTNAGYQNKLFAYTIDPATGEISNLEILSEDAKSDVGESYTYDVAAGAIVGIGIISPDGIFLSSGYGDNLDLNSDGKLHTQLLDVAPDGSVQIGFEDIQFLGDADFNDVRVTVDLGTSGATFDNAHVNYSSDGADPDDSGSGDDVLMGEDGADTIHGQDGNDTLMGGAGTDVLDGGRGDDRLEGGEGSDILVGGDGDDIVAGNEGRDLLSGGAGDDLVIGDGVPGADDGSNGGGDILFGGGGSDTLIGGVGDDILDGGDGADKQDGGTGDDLFVDVGAGDQISGGDGDDTLVLSGPAIIEYDDPTDPTSGTINFLTPGSPDPVGQASFEGIETLTYVIPEPDPVEPADPPMAGPAVTDLPPGPTDGIVDGTAGDDEMDAAYVDGEGDRIDDGVSLPGLGGNDDVVRGYEGDDEIQSGVGNDFVLAGAGDDLVDAGIGDDIVRGEGGDDVLLGFEGNDQLRGDDGDDLLSGMEGDDVLVGGFGADILNGGEGNDVLVGGDADSPDSTNGDPSGDVLQAGTGSDVLFGDGGDDTLSLGTDTDVDVAFGGADADTFLEVAEGDVVFGGESGDDNDTIDLSGHAGPLTVNWTGDESGIITYFDAPDGNVTGVATFSEIENVIPCFTPGTLVATPEGRKPVEQLCVGDRVITRDNGIQQIRWYGQKKLDYGKLARVPRLQPILIPAGSLGDSLPERDMMVSPNHRMLVANDRTSLYFAEHEVLVAAKHLTGKHGIRRQTAFSTTYIHFMFDRHEVVLADGTWTESFQPGDYSLGGIDKGQRNEILEIFPELDTAEGRDGYVAARRTLKRHEAVLLHQ